MELLIYPIIFLGGLISGILSGIGGGGGGMLMIPFMIALGLPPQQAVATGKLGGLGAAFGGLSAFWKSGHIRRDILRVMIPVAVVVGLVTPFIFIQLNAEFMQNAIGILLLLMVPTLFIRKKNLKPQTRRRKGLGYSLYSVVLTLQAIFGTGIGSLALFILTLLLNATKLEANATKRAVTAVLSPLVFTGLLIAGFVRVDWGLAAVGGTFIGTHFGSKIAIRKGENFVTYAMAAVVTLSGILLLVS